MGHDKQSRTGAPVREGDEEPVGFEFPPEYAALIAKATSYWAALEYNIDMSIWHLAGVYPAVGACLTSQIFTLDGRLKALQSLLRLRQAPEVLLKRVNKFGEKVRTPQMIRNRITHDTWHQTVKTNNMVQLEIGARGTLSYGFKEIKISDLSTDVEKIRNAMRQASGIRDSIEAALPSLPEIPLRELHPTVLIGRGDPQTRSSDQTFLLFPPKPSQE